MTHWKVIIVPSFAVLCPDDLILKNLNFLCFCLFFALSLVLQFFLWLLTQKNKFPDINQNWIYPFSRSNLVTFKMQCSQRMAEMHPQHKKFDVKITKTDNQPNLPAWFFVRPSHKLKGTLLPCKVMGSCEDFNHCQNTCHNIRVRSSSTSCIVKLLLSLAEV